MNHIDIDELHSLVLAVVYRLNYCTLTFVDTFIAYGYRELI